MTRLRFKMTSIRHQPARVQDVSTSVAMGVMILADTWPKFIIGAVWFMWSALSFNRSR